MLPPIWSGEDYLKVGEFLSGKVKPFSIEAILHFIAICYFEDKKVPLFGGIDEVVYED